MLGGLFGSVCSIDITFDAEQNRKTAALGGAGPGVPVIRQVISAWCFHVMFHTDQSSQLWDHHGISSIMRIMGVCVSLKT